MRVIIDTTPETAKNPGLPHAPGYYKMFPLEPSAVLEWDMNISEGDITEIQNITLEDVLREMNGAVSLKEKVVLIVAHGDSDGFLMPVAQGSSAQANRENLERLLFVNWALDRAEELPSKDGVKGEEKVWKKFLTDPQPSHDEVVTHLQGKGKTQDRGVEDSSVTGPLTVAEMKTYFEETWLQQRAQELGMTRDRLRSHIVPLMKEVRGHLERVEIRACFMGADVDTLKVVRAFFGAQWIVAPTVKTFYVDVKPNVPREATPRAQRRRTDMPRSQWQRDQRRRRAEFGLLVRDLTVYEPESHRAWWTEAHLAMLSVRWWEAGRIDFPMWQPKESGSVMLVVEEYEPFLFRTYTFAETWEEVKNWVDQNVMFGKYHLHDRIFFLSGFWTFTPGGSMSAIPYALPGANPTKYRKLLVVEPAK